MIYLLAKLEPSSLSTSDFFMMIGGIISLCTVVVTCTAWIVSKLTKNSYKSEALEKEVVRTNEILETHIPECVKGRDSLQLKVESHSNRLNKHDTKLDEHTKLIAQQGET